MVEQIEKEPWKIIMVKEDDEKVRIESGKLPRR